MSAWFESMYACRVPIRCLGKPDARKVFSQISVDRDKLFDHMSFGAVTDGTILACLPSFSRIFRPIEMASWFSSSKAFAA